jgi:HK97 family phage major capsid protein
MSARPVKDTTMYIKLNDDQLLAVKKHVGADLRKIGISDLSEFSPHTLPWGELNERQKDLVKVARGLIDRIKDDTDADEARSIETAYDALMLAVQECDSEKDARAELGSRGPRDRGGAARVPRHKDILAGEGRAAEMEIYGLHREQRMADWIARSSGPDDFEGLTEGQYLRAMVTGARTDAERRALAGGTDSTGGYTVPELLSARMIDRMRAASVVFRAGAVTVPLGSDSNVIAKIATDPEPAWREENAPVAQSQPSFSRVLFEPKSLAVLVRVSRELLEDSLNIETALPALLARKMAEKVDTVSLFGSGIAPKPRGVVNFSGLTSNSFEGGELLSYAPLIQARTALRTVNSDVTAYIMSPREDGQLAMLTAKDGQPLLIPPAIANVPMLVTSKMPIGEGGEGEGEDDLSSAILAGEWRRLLVGMRWHLRIEVLRERFADKLQYGFLAHLRMDVAAEHEAAFTVLDGIVPPDPDGES